MAIFIFSLWEYEVFVTCINKLLFNSSKEFSCTAIQLFKLVTISPNFGTTCISYVYSDIHVTKKKQVLFDNISKNMFSCCYMPCTLPEGDNSGGLIWILYGVCYPTFTLYQSAKLFSFRNKMPETKKRQTF